MLQTCSFVEILSYLLDGLFLNESISLSGSLSPMGEHVKTHSGEELLLSIDVLVLGGDSIIHRKTAIFITNS